MTLRAAAGRALRGVPSVRRRDEVTRALRRDVARLTREVDSLAAENARLTQQVTSASWASHLPAVRRQFRMGMKLPDAGTMPLTRIAAKLANYRLAASHGVAIPQVHAVWDALDEVALDDLPDRFVLKSERGSAARGVLPLVREGDGYVLADGTARHTPASVIEHFARLEEVGRAVGPFFAEELLSDGSGRALPVDVKIFAYYGVIGQVRLRASDAHGSRSSRKRFLTADGEDLFADADTSLPVPHLLAEAVAAARTLSLAVPFPFVRVDVYDTPQGVVLGELTLAPGSDERHPLEHDQHLGFCYEHAQSRLLQDLHRGRPYALLYGDHPLDHAPRAWHAPGQAEVRWSPPVR
ncbi:ATP-grasp fold amidoligase family protein [Ornithinimicrobium cerasi]|uniref:TupA-like ATPgrasp n=1 Tax=Ornithinimicrobium cerasi TaxID=2248773 RepID=A0A285VJ12_9MICO|nr:ATP-grasp fold amidoligase family protein [Ornithinimicrobium cerasi]SOC53857.1 TupA-like ATPgrasp [Ornithinimicrobium cerasi]